MLRPPQVPPSAESQPAAAIATRSGFIQQSRIGRGGRAFTFWKFRVMHADTRQQFPELFADSDSPAAIQDLRFQPVLAG
jgi:hypothetical protein